MADPGAGAAAPGAPTVIADAVHIAYTVPTGPGTHRRVHAVRGVGFVARRGESIGLIGSNGSGKSTLLKAIAGLQQTESGRVYTRGRPALLGVDAALMGDLSGERNVILGGLAMGMSRSGIASRYEGIVDFSGLPDGRDGRENALARPMRTYSSGMAARLRFAIAATARSHDVLLVDEALATGDARFQRRSRRRIDELRAAAGTVFLVAHSHATIRETCDRALWLEAGTLRMDGPAEEVTAAYEEFTRTGATPPDE
ncbi:ABC transporter ATP-binding protein [Streptomyces filamentosus]|uniref:ABC transporter ATP-binding protein n=1 Tax=Streptomyces filamentosus TaxID=67294 RepID=A0A919BMA8_STRFL|nr:ABC transporter ATP-binding protein [Streptomyces filamentosus]GHF99020.1 ABC transporter ATP-binding protein [Streptomyces filamentosus]